MSPAELEIHRKSTAAFIAADSLELILHPQEVTRTAAGGYTYAPLPARPSQTFRLIPANDRMPEVRTSSGRMIAPSYTILGNFDAMMDRWDRFEHNGVWYEIVSEIRPQHSNNVYERKADVVRREES